MKLLPLTKGKFAQVDDEDFDRLNEWKWRASCDWRNSKSANCFGRRTVYLGGQTPNTKATTSKGKKHTQTINLGKEVMGIPYDKKLRIDHIDGNKLNCQKSNLRIATIPQIYYGITSRTKTPNKKISTSAYIGVSKNEMKEVRTLSTGKKRSYNIIYWRANIQDKEKRHIKLFPFTPEGETQAAKWYDAMARRIHGKFAILNFPKKELGGNLTTFVYEIGGL